MSTPVASTVSAGAPTTPAAPAISPAPPAAPAAAAGDDLKALRAELDSLKGKVADSERNAQFWHDKATKGAIPAAKPADKTPDPLDEIDLLDVITTKGAKGLIEVLRKGGIGISKEEAETLVNSKASQLTTEAQLVKDYPELNDKKSEFFQLTAQHYGQLKEKGVPEQMAMELAAERADLQMLRDGKRKTPAQQKDDDKAEREKDRRARIAAQSGDRGGRPPVESEEDDELTPQQEKIALNMLLGEPGADGKPMNREQAIDKYKERAKKGVAMKGRG